MTAMAITTDTAATIAPLTESTSACTTAGIVVTIAAVVIVTALHESLEATETVSVEEALSRGALSKEEGQATAEALSAEAIL